MSTYARIQNGAIAEIIVSNVDPSTLYNPALVWVPVTTSGAAIGWLYANGAFSTPPTPTLPTLITPSLSQLQAELATIQAQIATLTSSTTSASGG